MAQSSMEFMILFVIFLVAVGIAMVGSINRSRDISQAQIDLESNRIAGELANRINTAYLEGDGFSINITLTHSIFRKNYTINISSNEIILRVDGNTYIKYLLTNNVTGTPVKGTNRIFNRNSEIFITKAN